MQNSRLVQYFSQFSKTDWRNFKKFLESPYFNTRSDVRELSQYLQNQFQKTAELRKLGKAEVWKNVFPKQDFDDKQCRYLMSFLLENAEKFKTVETFLNKNEATEEQNLSQKRAAEANFETADKYQKFSEKSIVETLRLGCELLESAENQSITEGFPFLILVLNFCEKEQDFAKLPNIKVCLNTLKMLENKNAETGIPYFQVVKTCLKEEKNLSPEILRESLLRAINFAIRLQNTGHKVFGRETLDLYKFGIESGLLLENGLISKKAYSNTLVLALMVGEFVWAEDFLSRFKNLLPEHERENTFRHNLATLYFKQKQFGKVLETLQSVAFTDSLHNLDDRRLLLCSYYELAEWAALNSLLDSFGIWLRRAKNLGYHRDLYGNLVKFTRRCAEMPKNDLVGREKLRKRIEITKNVAAKEWLLEKVR